MWLFPDTRPETDVTCPYPVRQHALRRAAASSGRRERLTSFALLDHSWKRIFELTTISKRITLRSSAQITLGPNYSISFRRSSVDAST